MPLGVIIAGPPGAGKGTQCDLIVKKYGLVHISTGDLLRAEVQAGTALGLAAKGFMDSGGLVPDDVVIGMVKAKLATAEVRANGWLLDGFPRTAVQAKAMVSAGIVADLFINLNVPDAVLVPRIVGRRVDPKTNAVFHTSGGMPSDPEVLKRLVQRADDTAEKLEPRLKAFHANVAAIRGFYSAIELSLDGNRSKEAVFRDIVDRLAPRRAHVYVLVAALPLLGILLSAA